MSLIWLVGPAPRGFDGDFGTWYRKTAGASPRAALEQPARRDSSDPRTALKVS